MISYVIAFLCVIGMVIGQILFKLTGNSLHTTGSFFSPKTLIILFVSLAVYGITTIGWVWILQKLELGKIYPFMALAFIFVPLGSYFIFGERFQPQYFIGVALIMIGIVVAVKS